MIAGRAGISVGYLSRLEHGQRALDRRSLIVALAEALEVAPTELTDLAVAPPGDSVHAVPVDTVRAALLSVTLGDHGPEVQSVDALRARVGVLLDDQQHCRHDQVGAELPKLIVDLHAATAHGRQDGALLPLLVLLHIQGTQAWLRDVGAPLDLGWQAVVLAKQAATRLDDPAVQGIATFGTAHALLAAGTFDLAGRVLAAAPTVTGASGGEQLAGMLSFTSSLLAAVENRHADVVAALDQAADLAEHTGEGNAWWFGFGPTNVAIWRMACALEAGDHEAAAAVADTIDPARIPSPQRRAAYWADRGRALSRLRGRTSDAVAALRTAEQISPTRVRHHPWTRETLAELVSRSRHDAVGRELRGMAYRAGLHV